MSIVLGATQLLRRVKGDTGHKIIGRVWAGLMLFVAAGSFLFGGFTRPIDVFLRVLAAWTLYGVSFGLISARRGRIPRHRRLMVGTYVGLIGAFVGVVAVPSRRVDSWFWAHPVTMSLIAVAVIATAGSFVAGVLARYRSERPVTPTRVG